MKRKMFEYTAIRSWLWQRCANAEDCHNWDMYHVWCDLFNQLSAEYVEIGKPYLERYLQRVQS